MIDRRNFYINGQWVAPTAANDFEVINPSTEQVCATISLGGAADTNAAVAAAKAAFVPWSSAASELPAWATARRAGSVDSVPRC